MPPFNYPGKGRRGLIITLSVLSVGLVLAGIFHEEEAPIAPRGQLVTGTVAEAQSEPGVPS